MQKSEKHINNLMDMIPHRLVRWEENNDNHLISLLKPKFRVNLIQKRLNNPFYKINLDITGSIIWKNINGTKTVFALANDLQNQIEEPLKQLYERVATFIVNLERNRLIRLESVIRPDS